MPSAYNVSVCPGDREIIRSGARSKVTLRPASSVTVIGNVVPTVGDGATVGTVVGGIGVAVGRATVAVGGADVGLAGRAVALGAVVVAVGIATAAGADVADGGAAT
jgi:hypothetical protein